MLYAAYQPVEDLVSASNTFAGLLSAGIGLLPPALRASLPVRALHANAELVKHTHITHDRPDFRIEAVTVGGERVGVTPRVVDSSPFAALVHFAKDSTPDQPPVLVVAPLSGHFATLLRETVLTLLADHDVYLTDWHNARDVPLAAGAFGFDDYVEHVMRFVERIGPGVNLMAVCQPAVPVLAATALLAQARSAAQPRTLTLMAGPVDARISPTKVNDLAMSQSIEWFEANVLATVPQRFAGSGRRVYPGFMQLTAFMSMNLDRHLRTHIELWGNLARGEWENAVSKRAFYDEYFAVGDMPAEFYLDTVRRVFQEHELARGRMEVNGQRVDLAAIRHTALLTVEGERDDICAPGQTVAAHDLCTKIPASRRAHHLQAGVGHYGVFSGSRWTREIYPRLSSFILSNR